MANRETQIGTTAVIGGSPNARITQVGETLVMMGTRNVRLTQLGITVVQPTPNPVPAGKIMEFNTPT